MSNLTDKQRADKYRQAAGLMDELGQRATAENYRATADAYDLADRLAYDPFTGRGADSETDAARLTTSTGDLRDARDRADAARRRERVNAQLRQEQTND